MRFPNHIPGLHPVSVGRLRVDPVRDWSVLLVVVAVAFVAIFGLSAWSFDTAAYGRVASGAIASSSPAFSQASLDAINAVFADRANEEQNYVTGAYRFADPSATSTSR